MKLNIAQHWDCIGVRVFGEVVQSYCVTGHRSGKHLARFSDHWVLHGPVNLELMRVLILAQE